MGKHAEGASTVVRWRVESLPHGSRPLDQRLVVTAPWLLVPAHAAVRRLAPGSRLRRVALTRLAKLGMALVDREDWRAIQSVLRADVEIQYYPDAPSQRPSDVGPLYSGPHAYVDVLRGARSAFGDSRIELRELYDPGGDRLGLRTEYVATGAISGAQTAMPQFHVWEFSRGRLRRQSVLHSEEAMLAWLAS